MYREWTIRSNFRQAASKVSKVPHVTSPRRLLCTIGASFSHARLPILDPLTFSGPTRTSQRSFKPTFNGGEQRIRLSLQGCIDWRLRRRKVQLYVLGDVPCFMVLPERFSAWEEFGWGLRSRLGELVLTSLVSRTQCSPGSHVMSTMWSPSRPSVSNLLRVRLTLTGRPSRRRFGIQVCVIFFSFVDTWAKLHCSGGI